MKTKAISVSITLVILLGFLLVFSLPLTAQNADNLLLKNFRPVSIYKIPATRIEKAAFPVIDVHSHDYARTDEDIAQWVRNMDVCGIDKDHCIDRSLGS